MPDLNLKRWLWGVCAGVLLLPCAANAAGLGRLTILSGLGQPLNVEVELVSPQKGETLTARLSPIDIYQQANLAYNPALVGARVSVERRANGQPYVKVVTSSNVSEPFAELLIELNSESGRITRQYTLLLDPPGYGRSAGEVAPPAPAVVDAPASRSPSASSITRAPAGRQDAPAPATASNSTTEGSRAAQGVPPGRSTPITKPAAPTSAPDTPTTGAKQYGPIKPGETLGRIARSVKPEGATLEQTLVGLYRQNPDAFIKKNMNLVKSGRILKVPEAAELTGVAQSEAVREVRLQSADFESFRNRVADRAGTAAEDGGVASGRIGARVAGRDAPEPRDTVRVSRGEPSVQAGTKAGPERLRALEEEAVAREKALAEANDRVAQLEKTIKDMQRLADMKKGGTAAQAQSGSAPAPTTPAVPASSSPTTARVPTPAAPAITAPTPAVSTTTTAPNPAASATTSAPTRAASPTTPGATPSSSTTSPLSLDTPPLPGSLALAPPQSGSGAAGSGPTSVAANSAPLDVYKAPTPTPLEGVSSAVPAKPPVAVAPAARHDLLNDILREPLYLAAGGVVLLGGLLVAMRRRRGSQPKAFKAESAGPALPLGGNESMARTSLSDVSHAQDKAKTSLVNTTAPVIAAPAAALASDAASMPPQRAPEAVVPAPSATEDNDLDFQVGTPGAAPPVTLSTPPAPTTAHPPPASPRGTEASGSLVERAMDTPGDNAVPGAVPISPMALDPVEPRLSQAASFEKQSEASAAEALPMLDLPNDAQQHGPVPTESAAVPDIEFKLADLDLDVAGKTIPVAEVKDGHWQDVQQKFDLAKAYQEMGDKDGARSILDEVIKEGDTAQQVQARRVLSLLN